MKQNFASFVLLYFAR